METFYLTSKKFCSNLVIGAMVILLLLAIMALVEGREGFLDGPSEVAIVLVALIGWLFVTQHENTQG